MTATPTPTPSAHIAPWKVIDNPPFALARNDTTRRTVTSSTSRPAEARPHRRFLEDVRACIPPKTACPGWSWEQRPRVRRTSGSEPWGVAASAGRFAPPASWSAGWLLVSGPRSIHPENQHGWPSPRKTQVTRSQVQKNSWTPPVTGLVAWGDILEGPGSCPGGAKENPGQSLVNPEDIPWRHPLNAGKMSCSVDLSHEKC